jgi:hypothetical protein
VVIDASIAANGPLTALPRMRGLTATVFARAWANAARTPGTARIGPMLTKGLLGAMMTTSAVAIASMTPGAGREASLPS